MFGTARVHDPSLTRQQRRVLDFVGRFLQTEGYAPSLIEIRDYLGLSAVSTVHEHVSHLERKGYLTRGWNRSRSLTLTAKASPAGERRVRVVGTVAGGGPVRRLRAARRVEVPSHVATRGRVFGLRVRDDSLRGDGILEGDFLILDDAAPGPGDVVVARVRGRGTLVRRLVRDGETVALNPLTGRRRPLSTKRSDVRIEGTVVALVRAYRSKE